MKYLWQVTGLTELSPPNQILIIIVQIITTVFEGRSILGYFRNGASHFLKIMFAVMKTIF